MAVDKKMKILVTGGCGFIGHHIVEHIIKTTDWNIIIFDKLTYASVGFDRLRDISCFDNKRIKVLTVDFTQPISTGVDKETGEINYILHLGAETHVDRSIENAEPFVRTNVLGTMHLLNYARTIQGLKRFLYFSTDEVFGAAPIGISYKEWDRYNSGNPYAATKAGGEELCLSYSNSYNLPVIITHTMNCGGERQHPEKFIPSTIKKVYLGETVIIHSNKTKTKSGSRFYIHARNVADAILFLLHKGEIGDKYNIVGEKEIPNLELAQMIAKFVGKPLKYEMVDFHSSRPGHDLRYALDGTKLAKMGWLIPRKTEEWLKKTIEWSLRPENRHWLGF